VAAAGTDGAEALQARILADQKRGRRPIRSTIARTETTAKRAEALVAELLEITRELIEMSKRMAKQMAARSRSRWWQHSTGG
jgi:hypothetical protein